MRREPDSLSPPKPGGSHGSHTLKVYTGSVVGLHGNDVFVELGVRMQGVIALDHFGAAPGVGDSFEFTLRGQEDGLWGGALREVIPDTGKKYRASAILHKCSTRGAKNRVRSIGEELLWLGTPTPQS